MGQVCIPKIEAEKLRKAVQKGDISIEKLYELSSTGRRNLFTKHIGEIAAKNANALFERAMLSQQKQAVRNWIWKTFYDGKPLYRELSLEQSKRIRDAGLRMKDLRGLSAEQRISKLNEFVDKQTAETLNKRYEALKKTGNLSNWEERVISTKKMFEDKKLKGAFSKLEALDDLGVLNPNQIENFMEDFVSSKLGVDITVSESKQISSLVKRVSDNFDKVGDDWTANNRKNVVDYFVSRKSLEDFVNKLDPAPVAEIFTAVGARGAILFSLRSAFNSLAFQVIPGITTTFSKRIATAALIPSDIGRIQRMQIILSSVVPNKAELGFMMKNTKMALSIYKKTGYDVSRMQNLDDGFRFFGEKFTHINGPSFKEAQGVKEFMGAAVRGHARLMQPALKYAAGGTDTIFANLQRNDTTLTLSKMVAKMEKKAGKLPQGMTVEQRSKDLSKEALSFNPKSDIAQYIREMGITDGHRANYTNNDGWGQFAVRMRDSLNIGDVKLGIAAVPFLKIPATAAGAGFEASGAFMITGSQGIIKALKMAPGVDKNVAMAKALNKMIVGGGLFGSAVLFTSFLGVDDYVGPYDFTKRSENKLSLTKNAGSSYIRVGGNWYSTRWLGPLALPVGGIMQARQNRAQGRNALVGYAQGMFWGAAQFPGIKEVGEKMESINRAARSGDDEGIAKIIGIDPETIRKWWQVRVVPSFFTYDILALGNETRFDALGRPVPKRGDSVESAVIGAFIGANIKTDTSNAITKEFDRLLFTGNLPVLTDPSGKNVDEATERLGEDGYLERLNRLKQDYAQEVEHTIKQSWYKRLTPEEQKKEIDSIRKREILDRI